MFTLFFWITVEKVFNLRVLFRHKIKELCLSVREHPFILKEGGYGFFAGKKISIGKFDSKTNSVSEMARKNILLALCALKKYCFVEKKNVATTCREKNILLLYEAKKNKFDSEKNHSFKLNGCSLNICSDIPLQHWNSWNGASMS